MDPKGKGEDIQPPPPPGEPVTNTADTVGPQPIRSPFGVYSPQRQDHQPPLVPVTNAATNIVGPQQQEVKMKKKIGRPRKYARDGDVGDNKLPPKPPRPPKPPKLVKKKLGRPRKYGPDGEFIEPKPPAKPPAKRSKAEPMFTPYTIQVNTGEDINSKVLAFAGRQEPRTVWIISGTGAVSTATLSPGVTYEGRYDIVTLQGSFTDKVVSGILNVSFAGLDGNVVGGNVDGPLIAATQVKVLVVSFGAIEEIGGDNVEGLDPEAASAPANMSNSQGQSSELTDDNETQQPRQ